MHAKLSGIWIFALCAAGCEMCGSVKFSASCSCDNATKQTTGTCTYW